MDWREWSQRQEWGSAQPSVCNRMDEQMDAAELPGLCPTLLIPSWQGKQAGRQQAAAVEWEL